MFTTLQFRLPDGSLLPFEVRRALAAGVTGRDREKALAHIARMRQLGVKPPPHVPMLYPLMPTLVTNASDIGVVGPDSTPEIEVVMFRAGGTDYITVGSDHTDRRIEATSSVQGKNSCPKIVGTAAWPVTRVRDHWDALLLRSRCGETVLQEGNIDRLLHYDDLMTFVAEQDGDGHEGRLLFSGTVPILATPPKADVTITLQLIDPIADAMIEHRYTVHVLAEFFSTPK